ncbi:MAG: energy-coupling factor transporter ATPase [Clostridia bacterium]|nr:energy-coupling factor transporter ATPase [Clostridia bacterium]
MIELKNISYVYSKDSPFETAALSDVTLSIGEGEFVGIIGHTGSGKSTLVNIMGGIVKPTGGRVYIDGEDITEMKSVTKKLGGKIGVVFQYPEYQLFEETVYKDIAFGPKNLGIGADEIDKRVREAAKMTNISEELFEKSPFELSGGQKRRVAIAGILSMKPKMLILDEPAAGLDPGGREEILGQIKKMHSEYGITVVLVSHSMEDVAEICEKVIVMAKGKVIKYSHMDEVFKDSTELKNNGLSVPEVTEIMSELKKAGLSVRDDIYRMDDAVSELLALYGEVR